MLGKTPGSIVAMRPLQDGVIAEFDFTTTMLRDFFKKAAGASLFSGPRVVVCVPYGVTEVEKRAVIDAAQQAGAREAYLIEEPMAAAIGAGLPVAEGTNLVAGVPESMLTAIALGSVLFGAMTYIGNGPNFMVKAIAEKEGVRMPSFFAYIALALVTLLPIYALAEYLF